MEPIRTGRESGAIGLLRRLRYATIATRERRWSAPPVRRGSLSVGQSLVEFALVLPVVLLILLLTIDVGRLYYGWVNLQNAARIEANYAALHPTASLLYPWQRFGSQPAHRSPRQSMPRSRAVTGTGCCRSPRGSTPTTTWAVRSANSADRWKWGQADLGRLTPLATSGQCLRDEAAIQVQRLDPMKRQSAALSLFAGADVDGVVQDRGVGQELTGTTMTELTHQPRQSGAIGSGGSRGSATSPILPSLAQILHQPPSAPLGYTSPRSVQRDHPPTNGKEPLIPPGMLGIFNYGTLFSRQKTRRLSRPM